MSDFATNMEIDHAERVLLPEGCHFSEAKRSIIKHNDTADFHACPGSGKTTTLLAKIVILANRMPFADGRGICVLTHTNVAIDEIKARLGEKANVLFSYPNFFGTFQTFVHKFFTEQALWHYYKTKLTYVDDNFALKKLAHAVKYKGALWYTLKHRWEGSKSELSLNDYIANFMLTCRVDWTNKKVYPYRSKIGYRFESKPGAEVVNIKQDLYSQGILTYNEAYMMALGSIQATTDKDYKKILANRFAYVFIDEQQDMSPLQHQLADMIFGGANQVVQTFGDSDQSIFHESDENNEAKVIENSIDESCRFGEPIAKILRSVCTREYSNLCGDSNVESHRPIMIVYNDTQHVLPKFAEILSGYNLEGERLADIAQRKHAKDEAHRYFVKAIGYRVEHGKTSKSASALDVTSYFPSYERIGVITKNQSAHISDYLRTKGNEGVKEYRTNLASAVVIALDAYGIKDDKGKKFNATSLMRYLREKAPGKDVELKSKIAHWIMLLKNNEKQTIATEMQQYLANNLTTYLPPSYETGVQLPLFFAATEGESGADEQVVKSNVYHDEATGVDIEVASVHAVKGETHLATLYMETADYGSTESQVMKRALEGEVYEKAESDESKISRIMYVGMSRPKHLLCYAIHRDNYAKLDAEKVKLNWEVREI